MGAWFVFAVIGALFFGIQITLIKLILMRGLSAVLLTTYLFSMTALFLWVYTLATERVTLTAKLFYLILAVSAVATVANLSIFKSYELVSNPAYTRGVASVNLLIVLLLSSIFLNLKVTIPGIIGIVLIFIGTLLLAGVS